MGNLFALEEGRWSVISARKVIENWVKNSESVVLDPPDSLDRKMGVFVTLNTYPKKGLRGCIGYPLPILHLKEGLAKAAVSATMDPRFRPLSEKELEKIIVEVSLLTPPETVVVEKPEELPDMVTVGRDGLIASHGLNEGLLLPQVAVEYGWDAKMFIEQTCYKAGLPTNAWKMHDFKLKKFSAEVFSEIEPRGEIKRIALGE